jgi:cell wall-associated NlpC family hydrolase
MLAISRTPTPIRPSSVRSSSALSVDFRRSLARALFVLVSLAVAVAATLTVTATPADAVGKRARKVLHAKSVALGQLGDPYVYGAAGPGSFDCSGLIYYSYRRAGLGSIPRTSSSQARSARHISRKKLRPGDLMFFYNGYGVYHVGMFSKWKHGHAVMIHSPRPGRRVERVAPWTSRWFAGTFRHKKHR